MEIIVTKRYQGKTTKLINMSAESGAYIVCMNQKEASRIASIAQEQKKNIPFPITYSEFKNNEYYPKGIKGFLIDNADYFLQSMTSVPILAMTASE